MLHFRQTLAERRGHRIFTFGGAGNGAFIGNSNKGFERLQVVAQ
jgi:hypothetical protein